MVVDEEKKIENAVGQGVKKLSELVTKPGRSFVITKDDIPWEDIPVGAIKIDPKTGQALTKKEGGTTWDNVQTIAMADDVRASIKEAGERADTAIKKLEEATDLIDVDKKIAAEDTSVKKYVDDSIQTKVIDVKADSVTDGLMSHKDKIKLDNIEASAERNQINCVRLNNTSLEIDSMKTVNIDLSDYATQEDIKKLDLTRYVKKENITNDYLKNYVTIADMQNTIVPKLATKDEIVGIFRYKGTVNKYSDLPTTDQSTGDTYNVQNDDIPNKVRAGDNVCWNGTSWDCLSGIVDLSNYTTKDHVHANATEMVAGFMSADDKLALDTAVKQLAGKVNSAATADAATRAIQDEDGNQIKTTYAPLSSPALINIPTAPTADTAIKTNQIATTAFVHNVVDNFPAATKTTAGKVIVGDNLTIDTTGNLSVTKDNVTAALGYTPFSTVGGELFGKLIAHNGIDIATDYKFPNGTTVGYIKLCDSNNFINAEGTESTVMIGDLEGKATSVAVFYFVNGIDSNKNPNFKSSMIVAGVFNGNLYGNANTASKLKTPIKINGVSFDGSTDVILPSTAAIAENATKLATPRKITLTGDVTGNTLFDGSADVTLAANIDFDANTLQNINIMNSTIKALKDTNPTSDASKTAIANGTCSISRTNKDIVFDGAGGLNISATPSKVAFSIGTVDRAKADADGNTLSTSYAKLSGATFSGTVNVPTVEKTVSNTIAASTQYVHNVVADYNKGVKAIVPVTVTIRTTDWNNTAETTINNAAIQSSSIIMLTTPDGSSTDNYDMIADAALTASSQTDGSITLKYTGTKPTADISLVLNVIDQSLQLVPAFDRLSTPRIINLAGAVTGSVSFDGSKDVTMNTSLSIVHGYQMFITSGTFTVPDGVTKCKITCVGGAGGGGGALTVGSNNAAGGAGATGYNNIGIANVTPNSTVVVTIGGGGNGGAGATSGTSATKGDTGGASSFGSFLTAPGGLGGDGGYVSGTTYVTGSSSESYAGMHGAFYDYSVGGTGGTSSGAAGSAGTPGVVLVEW